MYNSSKMQKISRWDTFSLLHIFKKLPSHVDEIHWKTLYIGTKFTCTTQIGHIYPSVNDKNPVHISSLMCTYRLPGQRKQTASVSALPVIGGPRGLSRDYLCKYVALLYRVEAQLTRFVLIVLNQHINMHSSTKTCEKQSPLDFNCISLTLLLVLLTLNEKFLELLDIEHQ